MVHKKRSRRKKWFQLTQSDFLGGNIRCCKNSVRQQKAWERYPFLIYSRNKNFARSPPSSCCAATVRTHCSASTIGSERAFLCVARKVAARHNRKSKASACPSNKRVLILKSLSGSRLPSGAHSTDNTGRNRINRSARHRYQVLYAARVLLNRTSTDLLSGCILYT